MEEQIAILSLRSMLGKWRHESGAWYLFETNAFADFSDSRKYRVEHSPAPYRPINCFAITKSDLKNLMHRAKLKGYVQIEFAYPELQKYFRDGQPITIGDIIAESMEKATFTPIGDAFDNMMRSLI